MPGRLDIGVTGGAPNLAGSFTAAARPLPENAGWQPLGTSHVPEHCGLPWVWEQCSEGDKPLNPGADAVTFLPFLVEYNAQSCGGIPGDWEQLSDRAKRGLAVRLSNGITKAISSQTPDGTTPPDSPNLTTVAVDVSGAAPASIANTIAGLLEEAFACGATGEEWIWAPAWTLPHFLEATLLTQVGSVYKLGHHTVIFDQGFANEPPTGSPDAAVGEAWFYVSGPFEYATGAIQVLDDTTRGITVRENRANVIAAQLAIYRFDPCCVFAALGSVC